MAGKTAWYGHNAAFDHEIRTALDKITQPCLVLTNTGEDLYEHSGRTAALYERFEYAELEGGTHDIVDEQPEAGTTAVTDFVARR